MQLSKEQFKANMLAAIAEAEVHIDISNARFIITPIKEVNVKYNSLDDYIRLGMLSEANLKDRYFSLDEVVDFLVHPDHKFPLWINIQSRESQEKYSIFELQSSMRYRTPTQLKYIETGHPPFVFESK